MGVSYPKNNNKDNDETCTSTITYTCDASLEDILPPDEDKEEACLNKLMQDFSAKMIENIYPQLCDFKDKIVKKRKDKTYDSWNLECYWDIRKQHFIRGLINDEHIYFLELQETMKRTFSNSDLHKICGGKDFF